MNDRLTYEEKEKIKEVADQISNFVNGASMTSIDALGRALGRDHRTLVQLKGRMVMGFLAELKEQHSEGRYDMRNEAVCKFATDALKEVVFLPYV